MNNFKDILSFILAIIPIVWLLAGLSKLKMPAYRICLIGFAVTAAIALTYFKMPVTGALQASEEGILLALFPIIWVIITALFLYNTTLATGAMNDIRAMLTRISPDRRVQALIIAFAFGGFLEAVAGFGTAVAIPASILIAMGFRPLKAASVSLVANTVPVAFGVLGVPITTIAQVASLPLNKLTFYTAMQLFPFAVLLPLILTIIVTGSIRKVKGIVFISLLSGVVFAVAQTLTACFVGPEVAAVVGSLASLAVLVGYLKINPIKDVWKFEEDENYHDMGDPEKKVLSGRQDQRLITSVKAWIPYILVLIIVFAIKFLPALQFLNNYPFFLKAQFYYGSGGKPMSFQLATSGGTVLLISGILGGLIQGASVGTLLKIFVKTIRQTSRTIITILSIVALAKVMGYSGMTDSIARTLAVVTGSFYPLISPAIGAIGTFITGSDTSSNVLFGELQKQTALSIGANSEWIVSANAAGAAAGKMISPQSIAIAVSATGLANMEGKILKNVFKYCILFVVVMGILVFIGSHQ